MDDDEVTYGTGNAIPDFGGIAACLMNRLSRQDGRWSSTDHGDQALLQVLWNKRTSRRARLGARRP